MIATTILVLIVLLALSLPVAAAMGALGLVLDQVYSPLPLYRALGEVVWSASTDFILVAIPLFILLGEILLRSGIAERMYAAMVQWMSWLPGGLMHSNIAACALFASISGSSVATAATIGTVAIGEIDKRGYNERFFLGTLAAGGTLGILIPPSINMIIYGVLTQTSIPQLYLAGILPGVALAALFMLTVLIGCLIWPHWGGRKVRTDWPSRIRALPDLIPPLVIFVVVIGSIYAGLATATESAALGVLAALVLAGARRRLTWPVMRLIVEGTMKTTGMIMAILAGTYFLHAVRDDRDPLVLPAPGALAPPDRHALSAACPASSPAAPPSSPGPPAGSGAPSPRPSPRRAPPSSAPTSRSPTPSGWRPGFARPAGGPPRASAT